jgi:WASH complex subunit strumpellin
MVDYRHDPAKIVKKLIWAVKDGDIYNEIPAYPNPEHRSFALANQASMLFVVMYFTPDFLTSESVRY